MSKCIIKDWNESIVDPNEELTATPSVQRPRQATLSNIRGTFGVMETISEDGQETDIELISMSQLMKRKRKKTVEIIRDLIGL